MGANNKYTSKQVPQQETLRATPEQGDGGQAATLWWVIKDSLPRRGHWSLTGAIQSCIPGRGRAAAGRGAAHPSAVTRRRVCSAPVGKGEWA